MAMIIRGAGVKRKDNKTQIYTWAACILVFVFAISIGAAIKGAGKKSDSQAAYRKQAFDLGNMPFKDDSAEAYLLASNKYNDIAKNDLINGLFSQKQKEDRQAEDELNGAPAAPDAEYKAAEEEQAAKKNRIDRPVTGAKNQAPRGPSKGSLNKGSLATTSGSSGASGTIWRADNKVPIAGMQGNNNAALIAQVKGGKAMGFQHAAQASGRAANNSDLDAAAAGAADAFQKGAMEVGKDVLNTDLEKDALNWDDSDMQDKLDRAGNSDELAGLDAKLEEKKKEKDEEDKQANCEADGAFSSGACLGNAIFGLFKMVASAYIGSLF